MEVGRVGQIFLLHKYISATAVGELLGNLGLFPFMFKGIISGENNLEQYTNSGMFQLHNVTSTLPFLYGGMVVFNCQTYIVQIAFRIQVNEFYIRNNWNKEGWSVWTKK